MRVDEVAVQLNGLLVVLGGVGKFSEDEVKLGTMIVDVGVILVVSNS